jgi:hypothetical protein
MTYNPPRSSEQNQTPPGPPLTATNFNSNSPTIFAQIQSYASYSANYPLLSGSDANQIYNYNQQVSYYNSMNQQTLAIKQLNNTLGPTSQIPYPQFKTHADLLKYRQGLVMTASRNQITGNNPSLPAGYPASTIYQIISSEP